MKKKVNENEMYFPDYEYLIWQWLQLLLSGERFPFLIRRLDVSQGLAVHEVMRLQSLGKEKR